MKCVCLQQTCDTSIYNIVGPSTAQDEPRSSGAECSAGESTLDLESVDECEDIKRKFLVEMPQDFYDFWEFAKTVNAKTPSGQFYFIVCLMSRLANISFFSLLTC